MKESTNSISPAALRLWWVALLVKAALAVFIPLTTDEAYYWVWSRFLDWSYYDHPAMSAWLFKLAPYNTELGSVVRLPFVLMGHLTLWLWLKITAPYLRARYQILFLALLLLHPFTGLGSVLGTPDVPLMFFWSLSLYFLARILARGGLKNFALLGAALGLGFCSKYMMVLFVPALFLHLFLAPPEERARLLCIKGVSLTFLLGMIFSFPVLYWNFQNEWISVKFQADHGLGAPSWKPSWTLEYLAGQILLLFPPLLISIFRNPPQGKIRWLYPYALVPVLFFLFTTFRGHAEANWPLTTYPAWLALVVAGVSVSLRDFWVRLSLWILLGLNVVVAAESLHHFLPVPKERIKIHDLSRYDEITERAQELTLQGESVFTGSYQMASSLSYRLGQFYPKLPGVNRVDFYDHLETEIPESFAVFLISWHQLPKLYQDQGYQVVSEEKFSGDFKLLKVERAP